MSHAVAVLLCLLGLTWIPGAAHATYTRNPDLYRVKLDLDPMTAAMAVSTLAERKAKIVRGAACQDELSYWGATWSDDAHHRGEDSSAVVIAKEGVLLRKSADWFSGRNPVICSETVTGTLGQLRLPSGQDLAEDLLREEYSDFKQTVFVRNVDEQVVLVNQQIDRIQRNILVDLQVQVVDVFGDKCIGAVKNVELARMDAGVIQRSRAMAAKSDQRPDLVKLAVTYELPLRCLRAQLNVTLKNMVVLGRAGSSDLPCPFDGSATGEGIENKDRDAFKVHGEWDVDMRDLIRILYMNEESGKQRHDREPWLIDPSVVEHIRNDLFPLNTFVGQDTYSLLQCGAQEDGNGTALDRLSERDWTDKALDSIGDLFNWLLRRALLIILVVAGATAVLLLLPYLAPAVVVVGVAVAVAGVGGLGQVPETENHRLMIETTRFLHNQLLLQELEEKHSDTDVSNLKDDQEKVKAWLMKRLRKIYKDDFDEYNSRPYQRYSLKAIMNLSAFADDPKLRTAANMVLTTTGAKAALASNMSVRYVPFRCLPTSLNSQFLCSSKEGLQSCPSVTDLAGGADHWIGLLEVYSGQTPQRMGMMSIAAAREVIYAATTDYGLPQSVVALAIPDEQTQPRWQIRHHEVPEVTYSERAFLVTAGGKNSGPANRLEMGIFGLSVSTRLGGRADEGTAAPTTLQFRPSVGTGPGRMPPTPTLPLGPRATDQALPTPSPDNSILANLIRIYGKFDSDKDHPPWTDEPAPLRADEAKPMLTGNLCVHLGFACGRNLAIPAGLVACLVPEPTLPGLSYLDTGACPAIRNMARAYVVIWRAPCETGFLSSLLSLSSDCHNMGFFEAISADGLNFEVLKARVRSRNSEKAASGFACHDTYVSAVGEGRVIEYRCNEDHAIRSVDGVAAKAYTDEQRAKGNVIVRTGDGYIHTIWWPERGSSITLDWSDPDEPVHP